VSQAGLSLRRNWLLLAEAGAANMAAAQATASASSKKRLRDIL
jgi:hypothetical protein